MLNTEDALFRGQDFLRFRCAVAALSLVSTIACTQATPGVPVSDAARAEYKQRCALCHGENGDGRGPHATSLPVTVANWTDAAWQSQVSDDQLRQAILGGGAAIGKSPSMPPNPDLKGTPMLEELVVLIRGFDR